MDGLLFLDYQTQPTSQATVQPPAAAGSAVWPPSQTASSPQGFDTNGLYQIDSRHNTELSYTSTLQTTQGFEGVNVYGSQPALSAQVESQMNLGLGSQLDPSTGPNRPRTRRQVAKAQNSRSVSAPGLQAMAPDGTYYAGNMSPPALSRPQTPSGSISQGISINAPSHLHGQISLQSAGLQSHSPTYPSTPISTTSTASRYGFPHHSRSFSGAGSGARSASPALSVRSALTSISSTSAPPGLASNRMSPSYSEKQKKTRLTNSQRRDICLYHQTNPTARQEDMAVIWGVERSTISKILKAKAKWLASPLEDDNKTARHKPSKFPEIEREMEAWLQELHQTGKATTSLSDQVIRSRAKEIARGQNISEDKFKASSGWVENFKHRHNIRRGVWYGQEYQDLYSPSQTPAEDVDAIMQDEAETEVPMYPPPLNPPSWPQGDPGASPHYPNWKEKSPPGVSSSSPCGAPEFVHPPQLQQGGQTAQTPQTPTQSSHYSLSGHQTLPTPASRPRHGPYRHVSAPMNLSTFGLGSEPSGDLPTLPHGYSDPHGHFASQATTPISPTSNNTNGAHTSVLDPYTDASGSIEQVPSIPLRIQTHFSALPSSLSGHPTTLEPQEDILSTDLALDSACPSHGTATPIPGSREAKDHMKAVLHFLDSQPEGAIVSKKDRETLAQIVSKLDPGEQQRQ